MTVKDAVLKVIIAHYPRVKNNILEHRYVIRYRLNNGWSTKDALYKPLRGVKKTAMLSEDNTYTRVIKNFTETLF